MVQYEESDVHRPPQLESEDESDDDSVLANTTRTSADIRRYDQGILEGEEEVEKLLSGTSEQSTVKNMFRRKDSSGTEVKISDRQRRQYEKDVRRDAKREARREKRRRSTGASKEEESELMYEMEEGHKDSSDSSGHSSEVDRVLLGDSRAPKTVCVCCRREGDAC